MKQPYPKNRKSQTPYGVLCHPERPRYGFGMCRSCYRAWKYHNDPVYREKTKATAKRTRLKNIDKAHDYKHRYYRAHKNDPKYRKAVRDRARRHYANNLEEMRAKKRVQGNRYRMSHGDKVRRNAREWRIKNPDLLFDYRLHEKYGISSREYRQMLLDQKGKCKICGRSGIKLVVDHDHVTNRVRGLICIRCNIALAIYENTEWMTKALAYLADPPMNKIIAMREENKLQ